MTAGRYTIVFTGLLADRKAGERIYMDRDGVARRGKLSIGSLGREISFSDLPEEQRRLVLETYRELWDL